MFDTLFQLLPDGALVVQGDGAIVRGNDAACALFGVDASDWSVRTIATCLAEPAARAHLADLLARRGALPPTALLMRRADGATFPARVTMQVVQSADPPLACVFVHDETAERRTAALLDESLHRFRAFFDGVHPAFLLRPTVDAPARDWEYIAANAPFERAARRAVPPGTRLRGLVPSTRASELGALYDDVLTTGTPRSYRVEWHGNRYLATAFSMPGREVAVSVLDVTEEERQRVALRAALDRFDAFMDASPSLKWMKDGEGRYLWVNAAFERTFGVSRAALDALVDERLVSPPLAVERRARDVEALFTSSPVRGLERLEATGGTRRWWQVVHFPVPTPGGTPVVGGMAHDVTAEHEADVALRASEARALAAQAQLELALAETRATEAKFLQVQKMEAVGRLAGGVAHDFNNLLTVILASTEVLAEIVAGHTARGLVDAPARAARRAADLTRQLLAFSRKQVLAPAVVRMDHAVARLVGLLGRLLGDDIELVTHHDDALGTCRVDPVQLEQVILNLAINARDAMPDGGRLEISTRNVDLDEAYAAQHPGARAGAYVQLVVSDSGIGMDAAVQARLFEPFFTTKPEGRGTGLGLSTVYGIVKQSGGTIFVYSEPGRGTTFRISFPRLDLAPSDVEPREAAPPAVHAGGHVLLVEDHPQVRRVVADALRRGGFEVEEAAGPDEALALLAEAGRRVDLLLTDLVMPRMNGRVLAEQARTQRPGLAVLFMSGYTEDAAIHQGAMAEGVGFVQKPVAGHVLRERVRLLLDEARPREL
jgi:PAS domain S-box-containing protein